MYISATSLNNLNNTRLAQNMAEVSMERLSSGMKINSGADDPSGLSIARGMSAISRGTSAALQNVQDGLSMINTIDAPLNEIQDMLIRMKGLAVRASNEAVLVPTCQDRTRLNNEAQSLIKEIDQVAKSIKFNYKKVLSGDHLVSIAETPGTAKTLQTAASNPTNPTWTDADTIIFTVDVNDTGDKTGARPSSAGDTTQRVFSWDINTGTNAPVTSKQLTRDPSGLSDPDGDGYYDGASRVNDPNNTAGAAGFMYPANDPDVDGDGWHATVDNNDSDSTETGTNLRTLNADRILPISLTTTSQDATAITWQNAVTKNFAAGAVDQADITSTSGNTYSVEVFDTGASAWTTVAAGQTGNQTINFAETNANSIRVVYDEPVSQLAGVTDITNLKNKDVSLAGAAAATAPIAYKHAFGGATQIDSLTIDASAGNYTVYKQVGGVISQVGGSGAAGVPTTYNPGAGVTDIWVDLDTPGANITQFDAVQNVGMNAPAFSGTDGVQDFYQIGVTGGGPSNVTDLDITLSNPASAYDIYYNGNVPPGIPDNSGVGSGPKNLGGTQSLTQIFIAVPTGESVTAVTATNALTTPAATAEPRYSNDALTTPGQTITSIDVEVTAGVGFELFDDLGNSIGGHQTGLGAGSPITINAGSINPNSLQARFDIGGQASDLISISPSATYALGAAANGFADVNPQNENVAVYKVDTSAGLADRSFDQITIDVKNGHPFSVEYSDDGATWNPIATMTNINGTGAPVTYNFTDTLVDTGGNDAYFRVTLHSGEKTTTAITGAPTFTNRIDRDGDGFPDAIETFRGSNPDVQVSMPDGAVASTAGSPEFAPDDDGDNVLDAPLLYDTRDVDFLASTNPYNVTWQTGTGNPLNSTGPGAQYPNPGDLVQANQVPSNIDSDGDTFADPLDPFKNKAEFATWVDGAATKGQADMVFVSNRGNPNDPATTYLYQATAPNASGTYQTYAQIAGTQGADNPTYSPDGMALAWEQGGEIWASMASTGCAGTFNTTYQVTQSGGQHPAWSPDNSQITFDRGGNLYIINADGSNEIALGVAGQNPAWMSDGDTIVYDDGANLKAYNTVTESTYDLGIAGTNPTLSPNGSKVAYLQGGALMASDLTIVREPPVLQVGGRNGENFRIEISYPDARSGHLGLTGTTIVTQTDAQNAIDTIDAAIDIVSDYRANTANIALRLRHVADDLEVFKINTEQSRSTLEDADMASEVISMTRSQLLRDTAQSSTVHSSDILRTAYLDSINETLAKTA